MNSPTSGPAQTDELRPEKMLSDDQVRERLAINSPELAAELLTLVQGQLAAETARQTRLDAKATSLLTAAGLSLTVAFSFGGLLLSKENGYLFGHAVVGTFGLALVCGVGAAIQAVRALHVRGGYMAPDGDTLFNVETLIRANDPPDIPPDDVQTPDSERTSDKERRDFGLMEYRKYLTPHLWKILVGHREVHEEKAEIIKCGQWLFLGFLGFLIVNCVLMAVAVSSHQ